MSSRPHLSLGIEDLERALAAAKGDAIALKLVADELGHRKTAAARKLQIKAVVALRAAKAGSPQLPATSPEPRVRPAPAPELARAGSMLAALLGRFGLDAPDGRPLHRYRLDAAAFAELEAAVKTRRGALAQPGRETAALFALWAAHWFSREYRGGVRNYADIGARLGVQLGQHQWTDLIELGLKVWGHGVIRRLERNHYLLTIAVHGGFPVQVLERGEGWLASYLREVVGRLLGHDDPNPDDALAVAQAAASGLRDTFRQEQFLLLAADLALAVVRLRREAEAGRPGVAPSLALTELRLDWRDDLPIAADTEGARRLVDGMLTAARIAKGLTGGAGCARVLRLQAGVWRPGLRLSVRGEIGGDRLEGLARPGERLGVHPLGALAGRLGEELAYLDPPGPDGGTWRLRPLTGRTELHEFPLAAAVEVSVQAPDGAARRLAWPGGEPQRSDVLTWEIDGEEDGAPTSLLLAANGSASLRAARVVVTAPGDWRVEWMDGREGELPTALGRTADGARLWLADAPVLLTSPGGLRYGVEPGADADVRDRIELFGTSPAGLDGADGTTLFVGPPRVCCRRGDALVQPRGDELLWRRDRAEPWAALAAAPLPTGSVEIMWRDARTRLVRDRVRAAILPATLRVERARDPLGWCYRFTGLGGMAVEPEAADGLAVEQRAGGGWALGFRGVPRRRVRFRLGHPGAGRAIAVELPFPLPDGLAHWDGRLLPAGRAVTPAELAEAVAFGEGPLKLRAELRGGLVATPAHFTLGDRELTLRPLARRIATDLAIAGLDAEVELQFLGGSGAPWRVRPFDARLDCRDGVVSVAELSGVDGAELVLVGRSTAALNQEREIIRFTPSDLLNRRGVPLPAELTGTWIIYLRSGRAVRSRPMAVTLPGPNPRTGGAGLAAAVAVEKSAARTAAIWEALDRLGDGGEDVAADLRWMHELLRSLDGLPPHALDVFGRLPQFPSALAALLLNAPDDETRARVWRLEDGLGFMWAALPLSAWTRALDGFSHAMLSGLAQAPLDAAVKADMVEDLARSACRGTAALDPALAAALAAADLVDAAEPCPTLAEAAVGYVRRTYDRGDLAIGLPTRDSVFRDGALGPHLPAFFVQRFDLSHLEALDAPVAAAAVARERAHLTLAQLLCAKAAAAADPVYFTEALAAAHAQHPR